MAGDFARSVQILIELAGNPEQRLNEINKLVDQLNGKKINLTDSMAQVSGGANNAVSSLKQVSNSTQDVTKNANDLGTKAVSSFDKIKSSVSQLNDGVQNLGASLAGIAAGGAISGLSWKASADFKLINEQIDDALAANKKLGISKEEMDAFVQEQAESGEGTRQDTKSEIYSVLMASQKYLKGDSLAKLNQADAITDFWFARQEIMKQQGISSPEQLIRMTTRSEGKMIGTQLARFQTATGASEKDAGSAKQRMKFLTGQETDMQVEMTKRPWEAMLVAVTQLKYAIGDGIAPAMTLFINLLAKGVKLINMIPLAPTIIGLAGGALATFSAWTLLVGVLRPGIAVIHSLVAVTNLHTLAQAKNLLVSKALIVTDWLGVTSKAARATATATAAASTAALTGAIGMEIVALEADAVATGTATVATTGLAAAEWAALSPLLLIAVPLIAVAGLLYLVEKRTHVFSNALKQLSETEMSQDVVQWFKDVGYWAGYAIDKFGGALGTGLSNNIAGLNSLYKLAKSGGSFLLGSSESEKDNGVVRKIANPLFATKANTESINEAIVWVKGILDSGWGIFSRIYAGIVNFPKNVWNFAVESLQKLVEWGVKGLLTGIGTLTSKIMDGIGSLLPDWLGGSGSKSEEGFIEFIRSAKKGDSNYDKYAQLSDEALRAAYREAQTGIPQDHPNMHDEYEYDNIVKNAYPEYMKSSPTVINNVNNVSLVGAADKVLQEDIAEVNRKLENGESVSRLSTDMGNPSGLLKTAYNYFFGDGFADGGYVKKSGLALVHSGEPIIPADVANSSRLQNILENIAYGGSSTSSTVNNQPIIQITYQVDPKSGVMMDKLSFERMVSDIVAKRLRQLNGY